MTKAMITVKNNRILPSFGYNHIDVGQPGNPKNYRICGSIPNGDEALGEYCQRPAGWGTNHAGAGRCKLHGGRKEPSLYSPLWRGRMKEIATYHLEQSGSYDPLDLMAELEVQRVILAALIDRLQEGAGPDEVMSVGNDLGERTAGATAATQAIVEELAKSPVTSRRRRGVMASRLETGGVGGVVTNAEHIVPVDDVQTQFSSSENENNDFTTSPENTSERNYYDMIDRVRMQAELIVNTVGKIITLRNQTAITKSEVAYLVMLLREGMDKFVPKENREAYVKWIMDNIPGMKRGDGVEGDE